MSICQPAPIAGNRNTATVVGPSYPWSAAAYPVPAGSRLRNVAVEGFQGDGLGFGSATYTLIEGVDRRELVGGELEVEHVEVGSDALGVDRLRDRGASLLEVPTQHHLRRGLAVYGGDLADLRIVERRRAAVTAIAGDATHRRPGLRQNPVLGVRLLRLGLGEVRVDLDLVDRGDDRRPLQQRREVFGHEVADPDRAYPPVRQQRLQRLVGADRLVEVGGQRLVQQEQVDLLDPELAGTLVERVQGLVVAVVADPDLRLHEDLRPVQPRAAD